MDQSIAYDITDLGEISISQLRSSSGTGFTIANRIVQSSQPIILVIHFLTTNRRATMPMVKVIKIVV